MPSSFVASSRTATLALSLMATFAIIYGVEDVSAQGGSYVDTVTFIKQEDPIAATNSLIEDDIDMYYLTVSGENLQNIRNAGHDIYESSGGTIYSMYVNPTDDHTVGFNPFSQQGARYALNYLIDRDHIVNNLIGSGSPMLSAIPPHNFDYLLVHRELASLGIMYDPSEADRLFRESLVPVGAIKSSDDKWYYNDEPIELILFIRDDDLVRKQIGESLADELERTGFVVNKKYGDLSSAFDTVSASDPADQEWHLYTEAWSSYGHTQYNDLILGVFYAPWAGNLPGENEEHIWNYMHDELDYLTLALYFQLYETLEQRAELITAATALGVHESVRIYLATERTSHAVRSGITGVTNLQFDGIANRYTPLNVQLPDGDTNLNIGTRHIVQSAWNPIGGLLDSYSVYAWSLLRDPSYVRDPYNMNILNARNTALSVETAGLGDTLDIPPSAVIWNPNLHMWDTPNATANAVSKVTIDLEFANWHHGQPMDINDILYLTVFSNEHSIMHDDHETIFVTDPFVSLSASPSIVAINVIDDDTIEVYTDYWHFDEDEIIVESRLWPTLPWEIYHVMDESVHDGAADWFATSAREHSGNWLDMLDSENAALALQYLSILKDPNNDNHIPDFLYQSQNSDYVNQRYDASISWIEGKNHMMVGNGPFYLSDVIVRDDSDSITKMVLNKFDDSTYPFGPGHWTDMFERIEPLSESISVGSLTSTTGNAYRYGQEIKVASELAVSHFNEYLKLRGDKWSLDVRHFDTGTNPNTALNHLMTLDDDNVDLVMGPSIDIISKDILDYANNNDMTLISCCSSVPSIAIADDALFRLLPDQHRHAQAVVDVMMHQNVGISHIIPVGIQAAWSVELLEATKSAFERSGGTSDDIIYYAYQFDDAGANTVTDVYDTYSETIKVLDATVREAIAQHGASNVAIFYSGFGEGPEFFKAASSYTILDNIRWFGADQNTADPNISSDPVSAAFADRVQFTVLQPAAVADKMINKEIRSHLLANNITPSSYSSYAYDTVWILGLSILNAQSIDSASVRNMIIPTAANYIGAVGSTAMNQNGDLIDTQYQTWMFSDTRWMQYDESDFSSFDDDIKICR